MLSLFGHANTDAVVSATPGAAKASAKASARANAAAALSAAKLSAEVAADVAAKTGTSSVATPRRDASGLLDRVCADPGGDDGSGEAEQDLAAKVRSAALRYVAALGSASPALLYTQWTHGALFHEDVPSTLTLLTGDR